MLLEDIQMQRSHSPVAVDIYGPYLAQHPIFGGWTLGVHAGGLVTQLKYATARIVET